MVSIRECELPQGALLAGYRRHGAYADCYVTVTERDVSQAEYVEAFYTTRIFRLERLLLAWAASRPSTDAQAKALARGEHDSFAAWSVEGRTADQLLLCDFHGRTRSWLKCEPLSGEASGSTRLYFGSAVVPRLNRQTGQATMGFAFRALLGFHKLYSRILLRAAVARLQRRPRCTAPD